MLTSFVAVLSLHGAAAAASASFGTHDYRQISISADGKSILWPDGRPMRLSPSSVSAFSQCPLLFRQRHIERLYEPATPEFVTGVLVHETLANLFALEREERRLDVAQSLFREKWIRMRRVPKYGALFGLSEEENKHTHKRELRDVERERTWGLKSLEILRQYFTLEDPARFDPIGIEEKMEVEIPESDVHGESGTIIPLTGTFDRLDKDAQGELIVNDYKTGRSPSEYAMDMTGRPRMDSAFQQLEIYALMLSLQDRTPDKMRLIFLGDGATLERPVDDEMLERTAGTLRKVWSDMKRACQTGEYECTCDGRACGRRSERGRGKFFPT